MAGRRINIFYLISFVCILILIGYIVLVFLPEVSGYSESSAATTVIAIVVALLFVAACIQLFLLLKPSQPEE